MKLHYPLLTSPSSPLMTPFFMPRDAASLKLQPLQQTLYRALTHLCILLRQPGSFWHTSASSHLFFRLSSVITSSKKPSLTPLKTQVPHPTLPCHSIEHTTWYLSTYLPGALTGLLTIGG